MGFVTVGDAKSDSTGISFFSSTKGGVAPYIGQGVGTRSGARGLVCMALQYGRRGRRANAGAAVCTIQGSMLPDMLPLK